MGVTASSSTAFRSVVPARAAPAIRERRRNKGSAGGSGCGRGPVPKLAVDSAAAAAADAPVAAAPHPSARPPEERESRDARLERFCGVCSEVVPGFLYLGGIAVASSGEALAASGIDHVLNCCGTAHPDATPAAWAGGRTVLYLYDSKHEDIGAHLYDVLDLAVRLRAEKKRLLVHCEKGVSRSSAFCVAILMHLEALGYEGALARVRRARGIAEPNVGFACQLIEWDARRRGSGATAAAAAAVRIAAKGPAGHAVLAPRLCLPPPPSPRVPIAPSWRVLDSRTATILVPSSHPEPSFPLCIFVGRSAPAAALSRAEQVLQQMRRYEAVGSGSAHAVVREGSEPPAFFEAFGKKEGGSEENLVFDDAAGVQALCAPVMEAPAKGNAEEQRGPEGEAHMEESPGGGMPPPSLVLDLDLDLDGASAAGPSAPPLLPREAAEVSPAADEEGERAACESKAAAARGEAAGSAAARGRPVLLAPGGEGAALQVVGMYCEDDLLASGWAVLRGDLAGGANFLVLNGGSVPDAASRLLGAQGVDVDACRVLQAGEEPDEFWEVFELGAA